MTPRYGWLGVITLSAVLTAISTYQSLRQYEELQSGWSWDLAYYNQWFWCLTHGIREITVRPVAAYAQEGPYIWKMNYLAPIRLAIVPFYPLAPDPRTLLVIQNVVFWWVIPAAYSLVRAESRSEVTAVSAAGFVPLTPLLWPLVWNDFRELQFAGAICLVGHKRHSRPVRTSGGTGIAGMLACRQEFAVMLATFCIVPPREPEPLDVWLRWRATCWVGTIWLLFGFFGYLRFAVAAVLPMHSSTSFSAPRRRWPKRSSRPRKRFSLDWERGPFWLSWHRGLLFWRCPGSGDFVTGAGPCGSWRPPSGTPSVTSSPWSSWCWQPA